MNRLYDLRQSHPVSQADWEAWNASPITKQLFEDAEVLAISMAETMPVTSADTAGLNAAKVKGVQEATDGIIDWLPTNLVRNND